jgi:hypothetical protein
MRAGGTTMRKRMRKNKYIRKFFQYIFLIILGLDTGWIHKGLGGVRAVRI